MISLKFGCDLNYTAKTETVFIFNLEVAKLLRHRDLDEQLTFSPQTNFRRYTAPDIQNRYVAVVAQPGPFSVKYRATLHLDVHRADAATIGEMAVRDLPLDILPYLLPSRFVSSDRLAAFAQKEFGDVPPGHARITHICNWIYDHVDYERGSTDGETTADEVLIQRAGVCRDFAHLGTAFCRALGIPARFVSCYAHGLEPSDFHAVFEAYLDGRWWLFDATRQADLDGLVRIGVGRDAAEIAFSTPFGDMDADPPRIFIERDDGTGTPLRTVDAISTEEPAPHAGAT